MDFQFTVSAGREIEFHNRVNDSDPTNAILRAMVLAAAGIETDDVLRAKTTFADILSGTTNEATNTGYSRQSFTDANVAAPTIDHTARTITAIIPTIITFSGISAGDSWAKLILGYDADSTGGTDADIIPVTAHDLLYQGSYVEPNGDDILVDLTAGYVRARIRT